MNAVVMNGYTRINKLAARKAYSEGKTIYLQSCNFRPVNCWQSACPINKVEDAARYGYEANDPELDFDRRVLNFEWYNCGDKERGYYAAYYVTGD